MLFFCSFLWIAAHWQLEIGARGDIYDGFFSINWYKRVQDRECNNFNFEGAKRRIVAGGGSAGSVSPPPRSDGETSQGSKEGRVLWHEIIINSDTQITGEAPAIQQVQELVLVLVLMMMYWKSQKRMAAKTMFHDILHCGIMWRRRWNH